MNEWTQNALKLYVGSDKFYKKRTEVKQTLAQNPNARRLVRIQDEPDDVLLKDYTLEDNLNLKAKLKCKQLYHIIQTKDDFNQKLKKQNTIAE